MAGTAGRNGAALDTYLRIAFWSVAALLLLAPLMAMRLTAEVAWGAEDFIFAGILIGVVGLAFEATMRMIRSWAHRFALGSAVAAAFAIVWANAAVGMIGEGPNMFNLLFLGVIALALAGAIAARFRPSGTSLAMAAAAAAHLAVAVAGMPVDPLGGACSALFAGLWLASAALFRKAAREHGAGTR